MRGAYGQDGPAAGDGPARLHPALLPLLAISLGIAGLISAWAVFAVVVVAAPWLVAVLLPWAHWLRRERPRRFARLAWLGAALVVAGIATAFAVQLAVPGVLTALVAFAAYGVLVGAPLLSDAP